MAVDAETNPRVKKSRNPDGSRDQRITDYAFATEPCVGAGSACVPPGLSSSAGGAG
jgi:hypothetical protein